MLIKGGREMCVLYLRVSRENMACPDLSIAVCWLHEGLSQRSSSNWAIVYRIVPRLLEESR
jgi:hypothetical protein